MTRKFAVVLLLGSTLLGTAHGQQEAVSKNTTPQECWRRLQAAQANQDFADALACMTEAMQCLTLGGIALELERSALSGTPLEKQVPALRDKHGIGSLDIMGHLQVLSMTNKDPSLGLIEAGAWIEDRAAFMQEATELLEVAAAAVKKVQAAQEAGSAQDKAAEQKGKRRPRKPDPKSDRSDMSTTPKRQFPPPVELVDVKIRGDIAKAFLNLAERGSPNEDRQQLSFRKIKGEWLLAVSSREPAIQRPTEGARVRALLASCGQLDRDYLLNVDDKSDESRDAQDQPNRFKHDNKHGAWRPITDEHLRLLPNVASLRAVEITEAPAVTDAGIKSLVGVKRLTRLTLNDLNITATSLEPLIKLPELRRVELHNIDISDAQIAKFRREAPECSIVESYSLETKQFEKSFTEVRDPQRVTALMVAEFPVPLRRPFPQEEIPLAPDPQMKALFRLVRLHNVQLLDDPPFSRKDDPKWWKERPYLKPNTMPQLVIFPKGNGKPIEIDGKITADRVAKAIKDALSAGE